MCKDLSSGADLGLKRKRGEVNVCYGIKKKAEYSINSIRNKKWMMINGQK